MPYRQRADAVEPSDAGGGALAAFDASGRHGQGADPGRPGRGGADDGQDGGRGEDAGPAEPGQDAGALELSLQEPPDAPGVVRLEGTRVEPGGARGGIEAVAPFGAAGFVELTARGGSGGHGGQGGRGGDGATGYRGSDATRYSNGSTGGPGGDGGDGGCGSDGAAAGRGGAVTVRVSERDTHLLMLLAADVRGGEGGSAGEHGDGGSAGSGGSGGSSYSWTESDSYTDSSGRRQTRTTRHHNPGGSDGSPGRSGRPASGALHPGADGDAGTLTVEITDGAQAGQYAGRYDLQLVAFEHRCDNRDGVYEPEEMVHVSRITVENVGVMPTPAHHDIELRLQDRGWVVPEKKHLTLPRGLAPGARHVFDEALRFQIGVFRPTKADDPLAASEDIAHRATLPAVQRDFEAYQGEATAEAARLLIRFPLQVTAIETLYSLAPDQAAQIRWTVTNVSSKAFGAASELGRAARTRLFLFESELGPDELLFFDETGARISLETSFVHTLPTIGPGESCQVSGIVAVAPSAAHYRAGKISMSLELGAITAPKEARPIQLRDFAVRVGMPYHADASASVLLLSNNRSTEGEVAAWRALVEALGGRAAVWDVSLEGGVDLERSDSGPSLLEQFAGKTLVVLNNETDSPGGARRASSSVAKAQLLHAAAGGARVLFVGGTPNLESLAVHRTAAPETTREDTGSLCEALATRPPEALGAPGGAVDVPVPITCWWPWSQPEEGALHAVAARLSRKLSSAEPHRRYVVSYAFAPELAKQTAWVRTYRGSTITVRRELDGQTPAILAAEVADDELHDPAQVLGSSTTTALALATSFSAKLGALAALLGAPPRALAALPAATSAADQLAPDAEPAAPALPLHEITETLLGALLADLACEQLSLLQHGWGAPPAGLASCLPLLRELAATRLPVDCAELDAGAAAGSDGPEQAPAGPLVRLVATLRFFIDAQTGFWEHLPPFTWWRRAPRLRRAVRAALEAFVDRLAEGDAREAFQVAVVRERKRLRARARQAVRENEAIDERGFARDLLLAPFDAASVKTDLAVLATPTSRVRAHNEEERANARDAKRDRRRTQMARKAAAARADLAEARTTTDLLAGAARSAPEHQALPAHARRRIATAEAPSAAPEDGFEDLLDAITAPPHVTGDRSTTG